MPRVTSPIHGSLETEQVLVVPATVWEEAGAFTGFTANVDHYLPRLLHPAHLCFLDRAVAEQDPAFKQLIPYIVLRCGEQVFHYRRGRAGTETRLQAFRSLGIGGHISSQDGAIPLDPYRKGMMRELNEEVELYSGWSQRCIGLIYDPRTPVGAVHIGVVHVLDLEQPRARCREAALEAGEFAPLEKLRQVRTEFETWSQFLLDVLPK